MSRDHYEGKAESGAPLTERWYIKGRCWLAGLGRFLWSRKWSGLIAIGIVATAFLAGRTVPYLMLYRWTRLHVATHPGPYEFWTNWPLPDHPQLTALLHAHALACFAKRTVNATMVMSCALIVLVPGVFVLARLAKRKALATVGLTVAFLLGYMVSRGGMEPALSVYQALWQSETQGSGALYVYLYSATECRLTFQGEPASQPFVSLKHVSVDQSLSTFFLDDWVGASMPLDIRIPSEWFTSWEVVAEDRMDDFFWHPDGPGADQRLLPAYQRTWHLSCYRDFLERVWFPLDLFAEQ